MKIKFIEESHQYLSDGGELISVSKFTERFKEKVDWDTIAKRTAYKLTKEGTPTTKAEVLKKWERKRITSAQIGTLYHSIKEQELLREEITELYGRKCRKVTAGYLGGHKSSMPISEIENDTVYPELMIYDFEYMICGQSDKVIVADNKIHVWDYKTDQEITFKAFSNQWVKPRKLLKPLHKLDDANGNLYAIKMSLYMYLLWKANKGKFKPGEIIIEHVTLKRDPDNDNIPVLDNLGNPIVIKVQKIKLPYLKKEVIEMLKTLKDGNR
jgi:hypothetical protein